jgi:hypothetical protein
MHLQSLFHTIRQRVAWARLDPSPTLLLVALGLLDAAFESWDILFVIFVLACVIAYFAGGV